MPDAQKTTKEIGRRFDAQGEEGRPPTLQENGGHRMRSGGLRAQHRHATVNFKNGDIRKERRGRKNFQKKKDEKGQ